ncbi:tRNA(Ile)-lysidine synthase, partial [Streptomyces sp. IgraMP-1]
MGPHPAVAAIRLAVRRVLNDLIAEHPHPHPQPLAGQPGRPPRAELLERVGRATRAGRARQIRARAASGAPVQVPAPGEA